MVHDAERLQLLPPAVGVDQEEALHDVRPDFLNHNKYHYYHDHY